ncbi:hypothetical protein EDD85DRAFT_793725 [Armillaria nabsnona]|nr:hypothetical protein EDD85DRAFT_793725 [Armillaria nabsnona]
MYVPEEGDMEEDSEDEIEPKKQRVGSYEKDCNEGELMYPEELVTLRCEPVLSDPVPSANHICSTLVQSSPYANPTLSHTRTDESKASALSGTKPLHENLQRVHNGDKVLKVDPQKIYPEEWDSCASSSPSPELLISTTFLKMPMESPEPMSSYNSNSRAPSTPSSHSSMPSLCSYSDSDDSNDTYSPLSLDELTHGNMKSKYFAVEPVHLGKETKAALADLPNKPRYFVHREWGRYLVMQGVVDTPASTCIITKDSSKAEIAPTSQVLVFLKPGEMMLGREHIAEAVYTKDNLKTYKILDGDPPFTFLDVAITDIPEVYLNPWHPVLNHL